MDVLSLFDGISCGQIALGRCGIKYDNYFASETDKYAIEVAMKNYSNTIQIGDVRNVRYENGILYTDNGNFKTNIELLIGGSPCQGFSFSGKQLNFDDPRSKLFFEFVRILNEIKIFNPDVKFLLENVKMKKEYQDTISKYLGVEPILINSALLSAQNRIRLYWSNISNIEQPKDKGILLKDIVFDDSLFCGRIVGRRINNDGKRKDYSDIKIKQRLELRLDNKSGSLTTIQKDNILLTKNAIDYMNREVRGGRNHWDFKHHSDVRDKKSSAIVANFFKGVPYNVLKDWNCIRKFHPIECERLQTILDNYTEGVSNSQRYKMLGNAWTVDVIAHIFSHLK